MSLFARLQYRTGTKSSRTLKFRIYFCYPALRRTCKNYGVCTTYLMHNTDFTAYYGQILVWFGINYIPQGIIELMLRDEFVPVRYHTGLTRVLYRLCRTMRA